MTCKRLAVPTLLVHPALKSVLKGLMAANNGGSPISVLGVGTPRGHNLTLLKKLKEPRNEIIVKITDKFLNKIKN